jgi:siderophore synthetase component
MARKSKPWAVVLTCDNGGKVRTEHRSQPEAYRKVNAEREQAKADTTRVIAIHVEQWEPDYGHWALYEHAYPED